MLHNPISNELNQAQIAALDTMSRANGTTHALDLCRVGATLAYLAKIGVLEVAESPYSSRGTEYIMPWGLAESWRQFRGLTLYPLSELRAASVSTLVEEVRNSLINYCDKGTAITRKSHLKALAFKQLIVLADGDYYLTDGTSGGVDLWKENYTPVARVTPEPLTVGPIVVPKKQMGPDPELGRFAKRLANMRGLTERQKDELFAKERGIVA